MFGPGFLAGAWGGSHRTVHCPHCGRKQSVGRKPTPFDLTCKRCGRAFRVEQSGAVAIRKE